MIVYGFKIGKFHPYVRVGDVISNAAINPGIGRQKKLARGKVEDLGMLDAHIFRFPDSQSSTEGDDRAVRSFLSQMLGHITGCASIRDTHEDFRIAVVKNGVGPIFSDFGIHLADGLTVAVDVDLCATGLG